MRNVPGKGSFASFFYRKLVACEERMDKGGRGEEENISCSSSGGRKVHQPINQLWLFINFRAHLGKDIRKSVIRNKGKKKEKKKRRNLRLKRPRSVLLILLFSVQYQLFLVHRETNRLLFQGKGVVGDPGKQWGMSCSLPHSAPGRRHAGGRILMYNGRQSVRKQTTMKTKCSQ